MPSIEGLLHLPRASSELLLWLGAGCTILFGLVLAAEACRGWARRRAVRRRLSTRFRETAARAALDREESGLLVRSLAAEDPARAARALGSARAFSAVVDRTVGRLRAKGEDPTEALHLFAGIRRKLGLDRSRPGVPIASTRELAPGLAVQVSAGVGEERFHWPSTLLALDEERLILRLDDASRALPSGALLVRGGVTIGPGDDLSFYFWREGDAGYHFRRRVSETRFRGKGIVVVEHASDLDRQQEREFVRVEIDAGIVCRRIPAPLFERIVGSEDRIPSTRPSRARLLDLSGGGLRLRSIESFGPGDAIAIEPPFLRGLDLREPIYARLTRRGAYPDGTYGFAFTGIGDLLRDRIVGFVYRVERAKTRRAGACARAAQGPRDDGHP